MGDKYGIGDFQDDLMVELITWLETYTLNLDFAQVAFEHTMPGSALRVLMAEEIAHQVRQAHEPGAFYKLLDQFEGIAGFTAEVIEGLDMYECCGKDQLKRSRSKGDQQRFMVGIRSR